MLEGGPDPRCGSTSSRSASRRQRSGFRIGHSYFCLADPAACTTNRLRSVVEFDILPTLAEYWFDAPDKLHRWEENLRGVFNDD